MKIALVTYALQVGGVESFIFSLAKIFQNQDHEVDIIETTSKGIWSDNFRDKGLNVLTLTIGALENRKHHAVRLAKQMKNYDAILINDAPYAQSVLGMLSSKTIVLPILHNNLPSMIKNVLGNDGQWNKIVCVSPALQNVLLNHTSNDKVTVISNGVFVEDLWPKRENNFLTAEKINILFVGRIEDAQKGVLFLPDIVKLGIEKKLTNIHLTIVGDGPSITELKRKISIMKLEQYISVIGKKDHEEVISIMKNHTVLLMPSRYEGHPIVLLEAMAQGIVPIVTNLPGHTDHVVTHKENGYLCDLSNLESFTNSIIELEKDRKLLKSMSRQAWETVYDSYNTNQMCMKYLELIKEVTDELPIRRTNEIDFKMLSDLPNIPYKLVRPIRKIMKILGLWSSKEY